ncbi:cysteine hydrolase family protein [Ureibacillus acetophenoni]|uniref:cysteine hydrolase family protein n=1 Tax=Ureibacillus acetophenoni TaxID=614649 RepID=UPI000BE470B6|nr:cysteine hydrolase family protein [Ureibacillus acetophenoni]
MNQALLVIDAQQAIIDGDGNFETGVIEKERLISNINKVVQKATEENIPIIFIRDTSVADGEGAGFEVHPHITIPEEAVIFNKAATNSFYGTPLLGHLKELNVEHVAIMGCKTEYCIDTAVRTATVNGFDVTLVGDGHSTSDSSDLTAKQIIQHHNRVLNGLDNVDNFSLVRSSDDDLFNPIHNNYR